MDYVNNSIMDFIYVEKKDNSALSKLYKIYQHIMKHIYRTLIVIVILALIYTLAISFIKIDGNYKFTEVGYCGNK